MTVDDRFDGRFTFCRGASRADIHPVRAAALALVALVALAVSPHRAGPARSPSHADRGQALAFDLSPSRAPVPEPSIKTAVQAMSLAVPNVLPAR